MRNISTNNSINNREDCRQRATRLSERRGCQYRGGRDGGVRTTRARLATAVQCERSEKIRTGGECNEGFEGRVRVLAAGDEHGGADEVLGERGGREEEEQMVRVRELGRGW
jgi:hypothetical protein